MAGGVNLYAYAGNNPVTFSDPYGLSPDGGVLEVGLLTAAVGLGIVTAAYTYAHGDDLRSAANAGYKAGAALVTGVLFAVSDKVHEAHLAGTQKMINQHFDWLGGSGGPGKDPGKWGDKWKKDIGKAINRMRDRLERIKSKADRGKWQERIDKLEKQLDATE